MPKKTKAFLGSVHNILRVLKKKKWHETPEIACRDDMDAQDAFCQGVFFFKSFYLLSINKYKYVTIHNQIS